tara:strand:+ start:83 stop:463 length:381 start_codon:yes stop_codon:yes gene_type:complete
MEMSNLFVVFGLLRDSGVAMTYGRLKDVLTHTVKISSSADPSHVFHKFQQILSNEIPEFRVIGGSDRRNLEIPWERYGTLKEICQNFANGFIDNIEGRMRDGKADVNFNLDVVREYFKEVEGYLVD